ncbi:uncharacterized protein LOC128405327 isoform X4 [Podarcis raffonei]|uniref:uncharacterized protein LOC128405327 isoform X4 n=1 Tax=Podarcis raffonei TaxID=65483 RepID=UPI00232941F5|nr:uncharacterized protein LOC128405327 isoform X4 [Podarcis raffonei]
MDVAQSPDNMEGLRHRFMQKCTVESGTRPASDTNLKNIIYMPTDGLLEKAGDLAHQPPDSGGRFWEELSIHPDFNANLPSDRRPQAAHAPTMHLIGSGGEASEPFPMPARWIPPSTRRHDDIDMEPSSDTQRANGSLSTGTATNLPGIIPRGSELPKDPEAEVQELVPDLALLMDVEPSETVGLSPTSPVAALPQPLDGDIVMLDETVVRKPKDILILERVGETLRQKKLRSPHT